MAHLHGRVWVRECIFSAPLDEYVLAHSLHLKFRAWLHESAKVDGEIIAKPRLSARRLKACRRRFSIPSRAKYSRERAYARSRQWLDERPIDEVKLISFTGSIEGLRCLLTSVSFSVVGESMSQLTGFLNELVCGKLSQRTVICWTVNTVSATCFIWSSEGKSQGSFLLNFKIV
jgi:hypothetical protein